MTATCKKENKENSKPSLARPTPKIERPHTGMSRAAIVAAFIAGAALVATVLVIADPGSASTEHTLVEKKAMLNHVAQKAHNNFFAQALDTACPFHVQANGMCPGAPAEYIQQDGCC